MCVCEGDSVCVRECGWERVWERESVYGSEGEWVSKRGE